MNLRTIPDRHYRYLSKYHALALVNPVMRKIMTRDRVQRRLASLMRAYPIPYLDLGGASPVEGYLTLHLSPVEIYGLLVLARKTFHLAFDGNDESPRLLPKELTRPAVTLHFDALGGLPLADGSLMGVNLSHILEHFDLETGTKVLSECHRVLAKNGLIRISCPDLKKYARSYLSGDQEFFQEVGTRAFCNYYGLPTHGAVFAGKAYDAHIGHKLFYDAATVAALLVKIGFRNIDEREVHATRLPNIARIEPAWRAVESFYIEGTK